MKQKIYTVGENKSKKRIYSVDLSQVTVPNKDRLYSRLNNKSQVFDDRRFRKPKYKKNYLDY